MSINQGWNLLSSTIGFPIVGAFGDSTTFSSVWKWENGTWAVYLPGETNHGDYAASKGFTPLLTINSGEGFWVNATGASSVTISGTPAYGGPSFTSGWNLVGLKSATSTTVTDFIADKPGIVSLWKWENETWSVYLSGGDGGVSYTTSKGFGHMTTISPKEGVWVNMQ